MLRSTSFVATVGQVKVPCPKPTWKMRYFTANPEGKNPNENRAFLCFIALRNDTD